MIIAHMPFKMSPIPIGGGEYQFKASIKIKQVFRIKYGNTENLRRFRSWKYGRLGCSQTPHQVSALNMWNTRGVEGGRRHKNDVNSKTYN